MKQSELILSLKEQLNELREETEQLMQLEPKALTSPPAPGKWGAAQCFAHNVVATQHYLDRLPEALAKAKPTKGNFKPGYWGNYLTNWVTPTADGKRKKKVKTFSKFVPKKNDPESHIGAFTTFSNQLNQLSELLDIAQNKDLHGPKVVAAFPLFVLKPGDAFRFVMAHALRHSLQAKEAAGHFV